MDAVFCSQCEAENDSDDLFCGGCGHQLAAIPRLSKAEPPVTMLLPEVVMELERERRAEAAYVPAVGETHPDAYVALVLGVVGLIAWPAGIFAITRGNKAQKEIKSTGQLGMGMAQAGVTLGWIDVGFGVLALFLIAVL